MSTTEQPPEDDLAMAIKLADKTQSKIKDDPHFLANKPPVSPGIVEGVLAGLLVGVVCQPARTRLARFLKVRKMDEASIFDSILFTTHALVMAQSGLYFGTLFGAQHWITKLADSAAADPTTSPKGKMVQEVCKDPLIENLTKLDAVQNYDKLEANWWDRRSVILGEMGRAVQNCLSQQAKVQEGEAPSAKK